MSSVPKTMGIIVHHLNNSRSQRILWALEELGLDYTLKIYQRNPETQRAPPELKQVHPLGKSPVITDDGETLAESGAILEYLVEKYGNGRLIPQPGTHEKNQFRFWLHFSEGSAMTPLLMKMIFDKVEEQTPFIVYPIAKAISNKVKSSFIMPEITAHLDYMEAELTKNKWFAGEEFSAADIQMSFPIEAAHAGKLVGDNRPHLLEFLKSIHERPAYIKALEKGGPYNLGVHSK